jgi:hypothetical protein
MMSIFRIVSLFVVLGAFSLACSRPEPVRSDPPKAAVSAEKASPAAADKVVAPVVAPKKTALFNGLSGDEQKALKKTYAKQATETITIENAEQEAAALEKLVEDELAAE